MADRSLRGTGLGAKSFEDEAGVEFAPRREVGFDCPRAHHFELVFAEEAEIPSVWECPRCGAESLRSDGQRAEVKEEKPIRTHWDMLRERRSIAELEDLPRPAGPRRPPDLPQPRQTATAFTEPLPPPRPSRPAAEEAAPCCVRPAAIGRALRAAAPRSPRR